jgi:putative tryptophan/tyrosine transport system substrate-binding protein
MRRRKFIAGLAAAGAAWTFGARAQPAGSLPRLGYLSDESETPNRFSSYNPVLERLRELGYVDGRNIAINYRYADGKAERLPSLAADLAALPVNAILTVGTPAARAAIAATKTIPIVFSRAGDPVGLGLVTELAKPRGNATGVSIFTTELGGKRLELLKNAVPGLTRVAVLYELGFVPGELELKQLAAAAPSLGVQLHTVGVGSLAALEAALPDIMKESPDALFVGSSGWFEGHAELITDLAFKSRLPALYIRREYSDTGGLISYGVNFREMYRTAADYIARVLKGEKPTDLPVQEPVKIELVINLKTAKALDIAIAQPLLTTADEVIE